MRHAGEYAISTCYREQNLRQSFHAELKGLSLNDLSLEQMDAMWDEVKRVERSK